MVNEIDKDAKGIIKFPEYLAMMAKKYSDDNAEDEIRETFCVFDSVSQAYDLTANLKQHKNYFTSFAGRKRIY